MRSSRGASSSAGSIATTTRSSDLSVYDDPDERYRSEFDSREFQRDVEAAAEQLERNTRSLADVFIDFMEHGDQVEVAVGVQKWIGYVVAAGTELVTVEATDRVIAVALDHMTFARVVAARASAGRTYRPVSPATLAARLRELNGARADEVVELGGADLPPVVCKVTAVSSSHAELTTADGDLLVLPMGVIGFVATIT